MRVAREGVPFILLPLLILFLLLAEIFQLLVVLATPLADLIFPPDALENVQGEVLAVGPGKYIESKGDRIPPPLTEGDRVFYGKYAGTEIRVEGEELKILEVKDILAKFE